MTLFKIFDIASSGMNAQSVRLNTISSNIANAESVSSSIDTTYRARHPIFSAKTPDFAASLSASQQEYSSGVEVLGIVESPATLPQRYEPNHPMADEKGYVTYPNVNIVDEMANMISASRAYQTNVDVMDAAKQMMQKILTLGQ
jgi:flagellar basal-body rod protein FlgC